MLQSEASSGQLQAKESRQNIGLHSTQLMDEAFKVNHSVYSRFKMIMNRRRAVNMSRTRLKYSLFVADVGIHLKLHGYEMQIV